MVARHKLPVGINDFIDIYTRSPQCPIHPMPPFRRFVSIVVHKAEPVVPEMRFWVCYSPAYAYISLNFLFSIFPFVGGVVFGAGFVVLKTHASVLIKYPTGVFAVLWFFMALRAFRMSRQGAE